MTYRKTWLSYILWALFTCVTGVVLAAYGSLFWRKVLGYEISYRLTGLLVVLFSLVIVCYVLIRKVLLPFAYKHRISAHTRYLWGAIAACAFVLAGALYRVRLCMVSSVDRIVLTEFYEEAIVKAGGWYIKPMWHRLPYLYTVLLSGCMYFLGNKPVVGVWLQIAIQTITLMLSYALLKKVSGRIPALFLLFIFAFSPIYIEQIFILTPECLFLLIYLIGISVTERLVMDYCYRNPGAVLGTVKILFAGIIIGILGYLDPVMFTIIVFLAGIIIGKDVIRQYSVPLFFFSIAVSGITSAVILIIDTLYYGSIIIGSTARTSYPYDIALVEDMAAFYSLESFLWDGFLPVIMSAFLIMAFWNRKKLQNCTPWIALLLLMMIGAATYRLPVLFIWSVLAGIGLQQCFEPERSKAVIKILEAAKPLEVEEIMPEQTENTLKDAEVEKVAISSEEKTVQPDEKEVLESDKTEPVKLIENPLPLPKKHEKREMDYQYQVPEDKMKFDVEISEEDDFDI